MSQSQSFIHKNFEEKQTINQKQMVEKTEIIYYVKKQINQDQSNYIGKIDQYFKRRNTFSTQHDLKRNEEQDNLIHNNSQQIHNEYYQFNHLRILPLKIFIEKLQNKLSNQNQLFELILKVLIWSIVNEYYCNLNRYQLFHNRICLENILITSTKEQMYLQDNFSSIDVIFINFDVSNEFFNRSFEEKNSKDIKDIKQIIEELLYFMNQKQLIGNFSECLQKLRERFKNIEKNKEQIFKIQFSDQEIQKLDGLLLSKNMNQKIMTLPVLKAILLQNCYLNPNNFDKLVQDFEDICSIIETHQIQYQQEIRNFCNLLNDQIKQKYKLDITFDDYSNLNEDFEINVFKQIVDLANFQQDSMSKIKDIIESQYQKTIENSQRYIIEDYQSELNLFLLSLYCDLI
ncbi:unnamed protein product [Paramecium sonneborni]|uniref:Uncharacterized protein n=2 Tax=Paramecium sonneborni TaxID=65129 RepID=A0A8S1MBP4_9CILI|nr:unnamed protein product [Paramecium sonneborni]